MQRERCRLSGCRGAAIVMIIFTKQNSVSLFNSFLSSGWHPLHLSAYHGHLETCRLLVEARADVQAKDNGSAPPLVMIIFTKQNSVSLFNSFLSSGDQPLHQSARWGHLEICRLLVEARADVQAKNRKSAPRRFRRLPLTLCVLATAKRHSNGPSTATTPPLLRICAALAPANNALLRPAPPLALLPAPRRKCSSSSCCRRCAVAAFDA